MQQTNQIKARQIKAARALLDWSQEDLAHASGLSVATVRKLEFGHISPREATARNVRRSFEDNGLEFLEPDGVRHRPNDVATYLGPEGALDFLDDIRQTIKKDVKDILLVYSLKSPFDFGGDWHSRCMEEAMAISGNATIKCLLTEESAFLLPQTLFECRFIPTHYIDPAPLCVYGNKYAVFEAASVPKIVVMQSQLISQAIRRQFCSMWEKAKQQEERRDAKNYSRADSKAALIRTAQRTISFGAKP